MTFGLPRSLKSLKNHRYFNDFHICKCMGFVDDSFNLYEFREKQNIEYWLGRTAKSEECHDDLKGSQGRNFQH